MPVPLQRSRRFQNGPGILDKGLEVLLTRMVEQELKTESYLEQLRTRELTRWR